MPDSQDDTANRSSAAAWVDLGPADDVAPGRGRFVEHDGRLLAILREPDGRIHVVDDACPHAGGSLSAGGVEEGCVTCPWHGWQFGLADGRCPDNADYRIGIYPARERGGRVAARLPPRDNL